MKLFYQKYVKLIFFFIIFLSSIFFSFSNYSISDNKIIQIDNNDENNKSQNIILTQPVIQRQQNPEILLRISEINNKYKVQKNDTLYAIAKKFNVTVEELKKVNNLKDASFIKVGMLLIIPSNSLIVYSPVDKFEFKLKTEKILIIYSKSSIIFSPLTDAIVAYVGDISGFGKSTILQYNDYSIVISNFNEIFIQKGQKLNLSTCIGFSAVENVLNLSIFLKDKMLSLQEYLSKSN